MGAMNGRGIVSIVGTRKVLVGILLLFGSINITGALASDVKGAKDHPVVSRYKGSEIIYYKQDTFNEYSLFTGIVKSAGGADANPASIKALEGRVTYLTYRNPAERTTVEVFRNYQNALTEAGFKMLFTCKNTECGGRRFNQAITNNTNLIGSEGDQRYLAAILPREDGDIYISLYTAKANVGGGPDHKRVITELRVIEVESMQENMVTVDADAMARGIGEEGRIALYGILFDHDSATIKPESKATLEQIATLLNNKSNLKIVVVGHTDKQGSLEYNMDLSKRRAKAVEAALVRNYGIAQSRLSSWGVGYLSPIASNRNDTGRAKNRRVELVEK
jgi:outer membrane protein OmpA-like peptidoglycan-associated protein